jgi:ComF family protein
MAIAIGASFQQIGNALLDLLYPPRCGGCNDAGAGWWCPSCAAKVQRLDAARAIRSITLPDDTQIDAFSAALFAPPLREGIHRFKYESQPQLADAFGALMCNAWLASDLQVDAFVPVPLHPSRRRERGYNQSELLARVMSRHRKVPMRNYLKRLRHTEQQAHLGAHERRANVKDAFLADAAVRDCRIALVDDVLTTGATLAECALALKQAGATHVTAITLARAQT